MKLRPTVSPGPDGISNALLQLAAPGIAGPMAELLNVSLEQRRLPDTWKESNITPLHKRGSRQSVSKYRPINLLNAIPKCLSISFNVASMSLPSTNSLLNNQASEKRTQPRSSSSDLSTRGLPAWTKESMLPQSSLTLQRPSTRFGTTASSTSSNSWA